MESNVFQTIATRNPKEAIMLLRHNGYPVPKKPQELESYLKDYLKRNDNQNGFRSLAMIHPDKELILETLVVKQASFDAQENLNANAKSSDDKYKNCAGCAAMASIGADAKVEAVQDAKVLPASTINAIIISAAVILGLVIVTSVIGSK